MLAPTHFQEKGSLDTSVKNRSPQSPEPLHTASALDPPVGGDLTREAISSWFGTTIKLQRSHRLALEYEATVRFHHVDTAGILYFSRLFELCHEMLEELLRASGFPLEEILKSNDWVMPIVQASADYRRPMRLGEKLKISVFVSHVGTSSLTFDYEVIDEGGAPRAEAKLVHVVLNAKTFQSRTIPDEFLDSLNRLGLIHTPAQ